MKKIKGKKVLDSGVSEIIGSILLVSLVVGLMMVVTIVVLSQPLPDKIPETTAAFSLTNESGSYNVVITYTGGDALQSGEYQVVVNGKEIIPLPMKAFSVENRTLILENIPGTPPFDVSLYYKGNSGSTLLSKAIDLDEVNGESPPPPHDSYTITPSVSGGNGAIDPSTVQTVNSGATPTFTFNPAAGYHLNTVTVDGIAVTPFGNSYTFPAVTANHNIVGSFAINQAQYTITPSVSGGNGAIDPSTVQTVNSGATPTFTFNPAVGYHLNTVTVDGIAVTPVGNSYTFPAVTANHNIVGTFAVTTYTITASAGTGGSISPSGSVNVNSGSNQPFTISPNAGYSISNVQVDGVSKGAISSYTFTNVVANGHTIEAAFVGNPYTIAVTWHPPGLAEDKTVSTSPPVPAINVGNGDSVNVIGGTTQTFYFDGKKNKNVQDVYADSVRIGPPSDVGTWSYSFTDIFSSHTLYVFFKS